MYEYKTILFCLYGLQSGARAATGIFKQHLTVHGTIYRLYKNSRYSSVGYRKLPLDLYPEYQYNDCLSPINGLDIFTTK